MDSIEYEIKLLKSMGLWNHYNPNYSGIMDNIRNQYFGQFQGEILYNLFLMNVKLLTVFSAIIGIDTIKLLENYDKKNKDFINIIIDKFKERKDYISYFLLYTRTTFLKQSELENERNNFIRCLNEICKNHPLQAVKFKNIDEIIKQISYNCCFYLSYMGKNNRDIFKNYTNYLRKICPSLTYNSLYVNVTKLICNIR